MDSAGERAAFAGDGDEGETRVYPALVTSLLARGVTLPAPVAEPTPLIAEPEAEAEVGAEEMEGDFCAAITAVATRAAATVEGLCIVKVEVRASARVPSATKGAKPSPPTTEVLPFPPPPPLKA